MKPAPAVAHRIIEGTAFIMDPRNKHLHSLNETGTFIWRRLLDGQDAPAIAAALAAEFDVPETRALADVRGFVDELVEKGVLVKG